MLSIKRKKERKNDNTVRKCYHFCVSFFLVLVGCYHLCYHLMLYFFNRKNNNTVCKCYHFCVIIFPCTCWVSSFMLSFEVIIFHGQQMLSFSLVHILCYHFCYHLMLSFFTVSKCYHFYVIIYGIIFRVLSFMLSFDVIIFKVSKCYNFYVIIFPCTYFVLSFMLPFDVIIY